MLRQYTWIYDYMKILERPVHNMTPNSWYKYYLIMHKDHVNTLIWLISIYSVIKYKLISHDENVRI